MEFTNEFYKYDKRFSGFENHYWQTVGRKGAVHFHTLINKNGKYPPSCGLEFHHMEPPDYMKNEAPSHINCEIIGGRCWHDGTSMYASELWPIIKLNLDNGDHEQVFNILQLEYKRVFGTPTEQALEGK